MIRYYWIGAVGPGAMGPGATRPGAAFILGYNTYSTYELYPSFRRFQHYTVHIILLITTYLARGRYDIYTY
jgi:hypothetical protein